MDFDANKIKEYYEGLIVERDEAVTNALATKDERVNARFEEEKARIEEEVTAEIIAEAEAPYKHDIELCERFFKDEEEVDTEETEEEVGE